MQSQDLKPELKAWLDGADEHGVILFTFGSTVPLSSFPREDQIHVFEHLGRVPQRILMKYEKEPPIELPKNIRLERWIPQGEILAHPKLVLFVTHCGLMGTQESIAAGIPMMCVPIFADQMLNANVYVARGVGQRINPRQQLGRVNLTERILEMTAGGAYLRRAREMAARYRDRPRTVEEEAVWWVEYVVRHRGAPHLRPLGADLPLHQYLLLDVAAAGLLLLLLLLLPAALLARRLFAAVSSALLGSKSARGSKGGQAKKRQ